MSLFFFFSSRRRHTRFDCDWSSDVCSSDLLVSPGPSQFGVSCAKTAPSGPTERANSSVEYPPPAPSSPTRLPDPTPKKASIGTGLRWASIERSRSVRSAASVICGFWGAAQERTRAAARYTCRVMGSPTIVRARPADYFANRERMIDPAHAGRAASCDVCPELRGDASRVVRDERGGPQGGGPAEQRGRPGGRV